MKINLQWSDAPEFNTSESVLGWLGSFYVRPLQLPGKSWTYDSGEFELWFDARRIPTETSSFAGIDEAKAYAENWLQEQLEGIVK